MSRRKKISEFNLTGIYEGDLVFAVRCHMSNCINVVSHHYSAVHFLADLGAVVYDSRNKEDKSLPFFLYHPELHDLLCLGRFDSEGCFFPFVLNPILDFEDFVNYFNTDDSPHVLDWLTYRGYLDKPSVKFVEEYGLDYKKKGN